MKDRILDILYENEGRAISGQLLSEELGVSRTAVWKHIRNLISEGYDIEGSGGRGYVLREADVLNEYELIKELPSGIPFVFRKSVGSTNNLAKETARANEAEFMLVTADIQDSGRGRLGRNFESDNNKGTWCSFIMKPGLAPEDALIITVAAATAVCRTLNDVCGLKSGIKWPNDIIVNGRKICGILSEMSCETGAIEFIIAGIGINVNQEADDFSPEVSLTATSVMQETGHRYRRTQIISSLCYNMQEIYGLVRDRRNNEIVKKWNEYSVTDGQTVRILKNGEEIIARADGIDERGRLVVTGPDGKTVTYNSGEISVRGIMGYI